MMKKRYWTGIGILAGGILLPYLLLNLLADSTAGGMALQGLLDWISNLFRMARPLQAENVRSVLEALFSGIVYAALIYLALQFRFLRYLSAVGIAFVLRTCLDLLPYLWETEFYGEYLGVFLLAALASALFFSGLYLLLYPLIRLSGRLIKNLTLSLAAGAAVYFIVNILLILAGAYGSMHLLAAVFSDPSQIMGAAELWSLLRSAYLAMLLHLSLGVLFYILTTHQSFREAGESDKEEIPAISEESSVEIPEESDRKEDE